jgi:hypothetical protein
MQMITKELYEQWYADFYHDKAHYRRDEKPDGEDFHSLHDRVYFAEVMMRFPNYLPLGDEEKEWLVRSRRILDSAIAEFVNPGFAKGADDHELKLKTYLLMGRNLLVLPHAGQRASDFFEYAYNLIDRYSNQHSNEPELEKYNHHVYFFGISQKFRRDRWLR